MCRCILALTLTFLLSGISLPAQTASLGVISQSAGGHLNHAAAAVGTTVFDGDRLSTEPNGTLALRSGSVQLILTDDSAVLVNQDGAGLRAMLQRGTLAFRVENGGALRLSAVDVHVRPQSSAPTTGQVTLENCAVLVTSRVQALEVTVGKETKIVDEGKSYRVLIGGPCNNRSSRPTGAAVQGRFLAAPIVIGVVTIIGVRKALESPDRP